jgi:hypothetical protein
VVEFLGLLFVLFAFDIRMDPPILEALDPFECRRERLDEAICRETSSSKVRSRWVGMMPAACGAGPLEVSIMVNKDEGWSEYKVGRAVKARGDLRKSIDVWGVQEQVML